MPAVTVTIITRDEEANLPGALASAAWADEVLVVDAGSQDRTVELARAAGARVVETGWPGYGEQKNRAAALAVHDWVLSLDADERVGATLAAAVRGLPAEPAAAAFRLRRRNRFAGRPIRHWPWSWDRVARLYDRRRARFSERRVHESLRIDGPLQTLGGVLEHLSYAGWEDYWQRQERYAKLGAEEAAARGAMLGPGDLSFRPAAAFLRHWLGRGWFLNGRLGWQLARAAARGTRRKYELLGELETGEAGEGRR